MTTDVLDLGLRFELNCNICSDTLLQYTEEQIYSQLVTSITAVVFVWLFVQPAPGAALAHDETAGIKLF